MKKCKRCAGTGKSLPGGTNKCTECNGTGEAQLFEMIFWHHDQFPYVLWSRGFIQDDGTAYCPAYHACFRPAKIMSLSDARPLIQKLEELKSERAAILSMLAKRYKDRLDQIAPWLNVTPNPRS